MNDSLFRNRAVRVRFCFPDFATEGTVHPFVVDAVLQHLKKHACRHMLDTRCHAQNTLGNIAKLTLNDSAVPVLPACEVIANNQGYPTSPVANRPRLIIGLTLSASKGVCVCVCVLLPPCSQLQMCIRFCCMWFWHECFGGEGNSCSPMPPTWPSWTTLLTFCRSAQLRRENKWQESCVIT